LVERSLVFEFAGDKRQVEDVVDLRKPEPQAPLASGGIRRHDPHLRPQRVGVVSQPSCLDQETLAFTGEAEQHELHDAGRVGGDRFAVERMRVKERAGPIEQRVEPPVGDAGRLAVVARAGRRFKQFEHAGVDTVDIDHRRRVPARIVAQLTSGGRHLQIRRVVAHGDHDAGRVVDARLGKR
jgi:hypothetical protein